MMYKICICLLLQFLRRGCSVQCFMNPNSCHDSSQRHNTRLKMSYLDDLSASNNDNNQWYNANENNNDISKKKHQNSNNSQWKQSSSANTKKPSGSVPCGRGPNRSYLDAVTGSSGSGSATSKDEDDSKDEGGVQKMDSWSNRYLSDFADNKSGASITTPMAKRNNSDNDNNNNNNNNDSRVDVLNLLTQRSIQSFMHLLEQCRDPHSGKWIQIQEDFLQTGNLLDYHGTGARCIEEFGGTWHGSLISMIQEPKHTLIISAKRRGCGHGGWSSNNPYLQERLLKSRLL